MAAGDRTRVSEKDSGAGEGRGRTHVERNAGPEACFEHTQSDACDDQSCEVEPCGLWVRSSAMIFSDRKERKTVAAGKR